MLYLVQIFSVSFSVLTASLQSAWGSISSLAADVSLIKRLAYGLLLKLLYVLTPDQGTIDSSNNGINMVTLSKALYSRAAEFFWEVCRQTPPLSFTQNVTAYQFLGPYVIVLPRPESFGVGHFIYILALKWPTSRLSGRGKMKV